MFVKFFLYMIPSTTPSFFHRASSAATSDVRHSPPSSVVAVQRSVAISGPPSIEIKHAKETRKKIVNWNRVERRKIFSAIFYIYWKESGQEKNFKRQRKLQKKMKEELHVHKQKSTRKLCNLCCLLKRTSILFFASAGCLYPSEENLCDSCNLY